MILSTTDLKFEVQVVVSRVIYALRVCRSCCTCTHDMNSSLTMLDANCILVSKEVPKQHVKERSKPDDHLANMSVCNEVCSTTASDTEQYGHAALMLHVLMLGLLQGMP